MKGYPVGTKLVITWQDPTAHQGLWVIGRVVTRVPDPSGGFSDTEYFPGLTPQMVRLSIEDSELLWGWHPAEWMKPLEDPDETIEQEKENEVVV